MVYYVLGPLCIRMACHDLYKTILDLYLRVCNTNNSGFGQEAPLNSMVDPCIPQYLVFPLPLHTFKRPSPINHGK